MLETLESLGLTKSDAQVYIFLGKRGPQKAKNISKSLKIPRQTLYPTIKNLQSKGMITATLEHPARFNAVPFEKLLDLFVKAKTEEIQRIKTGKKGLLSDWQSIAVAEVGDEAPRFTVIEGSKFVYSRLRQMIEETENQLSVVSTTPGLVRDDLLGLLETEFTRASKSGIRIRFLTEFSERNLETLKNLVGRKRRTGINLEACS